MFGFALAVITGFLFTAGRNWTGRPTPTGPALAALDEACGQLPGEGLQRGTILAHDGDAAVGRQVTILKNFYRAMVAMGGAVGAVAACQFISSGGRVRNFQSWSLQRNERA